MNTFTLKAKLFALTVMIAVSSVACDNGGSVIQDAQNDINAATSLVEQTVTVSTGMVKNTVVDGNGIFSCPNGCD